MKKLEFTAWVGKGNPVFLDKRTDKHDEIIISGLYQTKGAEPLFGESDWWPPVQVRVTIEEIKEKKP